MLNNVKEKTKPLMIISREKQEVRSEILNQQIIPEILLCDQYFGKIVLC